MIYIFEMKRIAGAREKKQFPHNLVFIITFHDNIYLKEVMLSKRRSTGNLNLSLSKLSFSLCGEEEHEFSKQIQWIISSSVLLEHLQRGYVNCLGLSILVQTNRLCTLQRCDRSEKTVRMRCILGANLVQLCIERTGQGACLGGCLAAIQAKQSMAMWLCLKIMWSIWPQKTL
jgi:hypothetical protein